MLNQISKLDLEEITSKLKGIEFLVSGIVYLNNYDEESFSNGLLEYPHYTRPAEWVAADGKTYTVPEILTSGHHGKVAEWRHAESVAITKKRRPDLL